jgi:hypothetical protein
MPDDTDTSEDISASPAPQDVGVNVGSADSEISAALPEAGYEMLIKVSKSGIDG